VPGQLSHNAAPWMDLSETMRPHCLLHCHFQTVTPPADLQWFLRNKLPALFWLRRRKDHFCEARNILTGHWLTTCRLLRFHDFAAGKQGPEPSFASTEHHASRVARRPVSPLPVMHPPARGLLSGSPLAPPESHPGLGNTTITSSLAGGPPSLHHLRCQHRLDAKHGSGRWLPG